MAKTHCLCNGRINLVFFHKAKFGFKFQKKNIFMFSIEPYWEISILFEVSKEYYVTFSCRLRKGFGLVGGRVWGSLRPMLAAPAGHPIEKESTEIISILRNLKRRQPPWFIGHLICNFCRHYLNRHIQLNCRFIPYVCMCVCVPKKERNLFIFIFKWKKFLLEFSTLWYVSESWSILRNFVAFLIIWFMIESSLPLTF